MTQVKNLINKVAVVLLGLVMLSGLAVGTVSVAAETTTDPFGGTITTQTGDDDNVADLCEFTDTCENQDSVGGINGVVALILTVVQYAIYLVGAIALIFLVYGGFLFIVDPGGSGDGAEKGKKIIFNALIGLVIVVLSTAIVQIVTNVAEGINF